VEISKVEDGSYLAVVNRGGRMSPVPFGRRRLTASTIEELSGKVQEALKEAFQG
jgi:hypothetical protein